MLLAGGPGRSGWVVEARCGGGSGRQELVRESEYVSHGGRIKKGQSMQLYKKTIS